MGRLPFKSLETIESVVRLGSVTRAAAELRLSQSAISNSIRRFEHDLGQKLFERKGNSFSPTPAAEKIAQVAARAIVELNSAIPQKATTDGPDSVRLSVSPTFSARWLAPRLSAFRTAMKPAKLKVTSQVQFTDQADLWIRHAKRANWEGLMTTPLFHERKAPVVAPGLFSGGQTIDSRVLDYPLIGIGARQSEWTEWAHKAKLSTTITPETTFDVTLNAWDAAQSGSGVALGDIDLLKGEIARGDLLILGSTILTSYTYFLCRRSGEARRNVLRAWDWLSRS